MFYFNSHGAIFIKTARLCRIQAFLLVVYLSDGDSGSLSKGCCARQVLQVVGGKVSSPPESPQARTGAAGSRVVRLPAAGVMVILPV